MENGKSRAVAIVGLGAILPDAPNVAAFWENIKQGRYSVSDVDAKRWDPALFYDPDPAAPDKTYSKIGGWVRDYTWDPMKWGLPVPPRVAAAMDETQKWAIACTREALTDYGYPKRPLDTERTAVILGNAMGGEKHYFTVMRLYFPEYAHDLESAATFAALPEEVRRKITEELHERMNQRLPEVTEDCMPGELSNVVAGRIANLFNLRGPNFVCDAACASAMAAINAAAEGLMEHDYDAVLTGGIDRNMGASTFVKFCKIGALSATGSRPYAAGADGFVMGEGAAFFLMKRLADAEQAGDKIYTVLRGMGASSDGKGKGITAPNPVGQKLAIERAWENAGLSPATATYMEGHGTSTRVGDVVEVESISKVLGDCQLAPKSVAIGSVKSNFGHLKSAAGAAGLMKTVLAIHHGMLPPSLHCDKPNPDIDFTHSPVYVNTELKPWEVGKDELRRAGLSAFGFGGTNFHAVIEQYAPGRNNGNGKRSLAVAIPTTKQPPTFKAPPASAKSAKPPLRGALVVGATNVAGIVERLKRVQQEAVAGKAPAPAPPKESDLRAPERIAIDYADAADLADKAGKALKAFVYEQAPVWKALRAQGIYRGRGAAPKVAFLYTGQGSQYVNMLRPLRAQEPIVAETFADADRVMTPLLGEPLTDYVYVDSTEPQVIAKAEDDLRQTEITQPALLATDISMTRMLCAYGIAPDMVMGHSLGEYCALVAAGALSFDEGMLAVSARGRGMSSLAIADNGKMAAVFAPLAEIERIVKSVDGYVVIANINSNSQAVIGGASRAVEQAMAKFQAAGYEVTPLSVSHAFHTSIVAPANEPLRRQMEGLHMQSPAIPVVANVDGEFYPMGADVLPQMLDRLCRQIASPVQFVKGLRTLYDAGARVFVEVGPKKALAGFAEDVLGGNADVVSVFTNHPKIGDIPSFNQALCALYAAGLGTGVPDPKNEPVQKEAKPEATINTVISGAALGLPGTEHIFDDENVARILHGDQFIDTIPARFRHAMLDKHITRLVKSEGGGGSFETIDNVADVIKLAGRGGAFDIEKEFGITAERVAAFDRVTQLAIAVGIDALRDAGIPLVMRYKTTSKGTRLPDRWALPEALRDDTGVIFASAFPGYDSFAEFIARYHTDHARREQLAMLEDLRARAANADATLRAELVRRIEEVHHLLDTDPYIFERRFLLRVLAMGHSQFAEFIGARGPNTQINSACSSTAQAISLAEDWIRAGRCKRVGVISADDVTSDHLLEWIGAGFLASGAAATDENVEEAAIPFDRRRHGLLIGMGAAGLVIETAEGARERGIRPICEVLSTVTANSAFHGTRLDIEHIGGVMEKLIAQAEQHSGISRREIAPRTVFVSHETYTPARGGSASAEIHALRRVFGDAAEKIVIANTKGFTGHAMATGIEEVVAVKALETGTLPPVANFKEVDPELGALNLSKGGAYPIEYALRLGAGFGSQISMALFHWVPTPDGTRQSVHKLGYAYRIADRETWSAWLAKMAGGAAELEVVNRTLRVRDKAAPRVVEPAAEKRVAVVAAAALSSVMPVIAKPTLKPAVETRKPAAVAKKDDNVKARVLALVSEKTGYPSDMLDLDLDLEADLGVDTVKQAEVFAAIREMYNIARDENRKLRDYPTLAHVIRFVQEKRGDAVKAAPVLEPVIAPAPPLPVTTAAPAADDDSVRATILRIAAEKTGYPQDMLDLDLDLEADLGVDTVKQAEMFAAIREIYKIARDENRKLRDYPTLAHVIRFVKEKRTDVAPIPTSAPVQEVKPAPAAPPSDTSDDEIKQTILRIVAGKTGYPEDMLDLDLDLEADLGVDTVKQAEMFAAVRAAYNIPRDENLKLRDFPTLAHVIKFARDRRSGAAKAAPQIEKKVATAVTATPRPAAAGFEACERVPRRVPVMQPRPPLSMCKPTGVKLGPGTRVIVASDRSGVADALATWLAKDSVEVLRLDVTQTSDARKLQVQTWLTAGPIHGVYWLPTLDVEGELRDLAAWRTALQVRVKALYETMRALYEQSPFLVSATRLGGQHGYDAAGALAPLGGAVVGFTKSYKRERMAATVKAVDFEVAAEPDDVAQRLLEETLRDPGAIEIGYKDDQRWTIALEEQPIADGAPGLTLDHNSVFVITGAAGSIVSAITADLASASGGTFYLLDRVPAPDANNPDLKRFATDKEGLKRELFTRIQARGERATPALVEKELAALERAQAAQAAIDAVRAAGGTAHYLSVDLGEAGAVAGVIEQVRERSGRIDVLLHAAGIERSHFLPDKEPAEFDLVFGVKADGWFNLLHAIGDMPLGATVAFSSIAGRFGNGGQTDYSAANDLLCKLTSNLRTRRPATRALAVDWTAWGGIGMATRGSIPKMMELAGIDMLPPEAGIPWIRRELTSGGFRGEVVVGQRLGALLQEWDETGGLDSEAAPVGARGPMIGRAVGMRADCGVKIETPLDPKRQPFLHDHQIDGTPVLPGVMGIEAFAEASTCLLPGWRVAAIENVDFLTPFKFYRGEPRTVTLEAKFAARADALEGDCRLIGSRVLPNQKEPQLTTHFTGRVRLNRQSPEPARVAPPRPSGQTIEAVDIYRVYFHGPAYQVVERAWWDGARAVGQLKPDLKSNHYPPELVTLTAPRLLELCFQTAGIWEIATQGRLGLPQHVERVTLFRAIEPTTPCYAVVTPHAEQGSFDAEVVDDAGNLYLKLEGYRTVALPDAVDAERLRPFQALVLEAVGA